MQKTRHHQNRRRGRWCCSFTTPPLSPENHVKKAEVTTPPNPITTKKTGEIPTTQKTAPLARRILSPGRVSPISDQFTRNPTPKQQTSIPESSLPDTRIENGDECNLGIFDVRLNLKGKNGQLMVLELGSEVLRSNSLVFAELIEDFYRKNLSKGLCRIEVPEVENLSVFRETMEMMFEDDLESRLVKIGVFRAIDILEVSACIKFDRGISSCLKYIEAVPWTEEEEEKLKELLPKLNMDDALTSDILNRLYSFNPIDSQQTLTKHLISSITTCNDANTRNELKNLVKGLLCKSSVYEKDDPELNKDDLLSICKSCLSSLATLLEEASGGAAHNDLQRPTIRIEKSKPLLERISKQVDNVNWLFDILIDHQMAEEFADLWGDQMVMLEMHENSSPMVRYELSRVSAMVFIAMGTGKLHCRSETRLKLLRLWFRPMLSDFGWLQRCKKGLDMKVLEEAMGQSLLTLPLKEQYELFMDWFRCFSKNGSNECPNLGKAFQIWWRRSFLRGSESFAVECR